MAVPSSAALAAPHRGPAPTPEERALHWTIELLVTSQALSGDARMKILAALSPKIQGGQLPDVVTARLLLDSLNMKTASFARVSPEDAEFVFESLITLGDIVRAESSRADGLELPEPPLHLTAMSYCETAVGALRRLAANGGARWRADAVADFDERCDTYDLNDVYIQSPWVDKRTLENLQTALKRDAVSLLRGDIDPGRVLEKHHAEGKLCAALAAYCKKMIDAMGPAFLERVAADVGAGTYSPDAEYAKKKNEPAWEPTGIVLDRADAAGDLANVEKGFVRGGGADDADETDEEGPEAEADGEDDVDETASEEETRGRHKRKRPLSPEAPAAPAAPASRVVALAAAARGAAAGAAWTNLAKHAELDGADGERHSSENDAYAFDGTEEEGDESPGAEVARRRRQRLGAALVDGARRTGGGGGATIAWGASQGDGLATQGGTPVAAAGAPASRAARVTPGSLGRQYTRWSAAEEEYFVTLCEKHGVGKWAQILAEGQKAGKLRADLTSVHLKDKYRNLKTYRPTRRPSRT